MGSPNQPGSTPKCPAPPCLWSRARLHPPPPLAPRLPRWGAAAPGWGAAGSTPGSRGSTPAARRPGSRRLPRVGSWAPPRSRGAAAPFRAPRGNLGAGHMAGLAVPDLFTPATLAAFKSTLSPTCGRDESEVNKSGTADTALKTRLPPIYSGAPSTPGEPAAAPLGVSGSRDSLPSEGSRPEFLGEPPDRRGWQVA